MYTCGERSTKKNIILVCTHVLTGVINILPSGNKATLLKRMEREWLFDSKSLWMPGVFTSH